MKKLIKLFFILILSCFYIYSYLKSPLNIVDLSLLFFLINVFYYKKVNLYLQGITVFCLYWLFLFIILNKELSLNKSFIFILNVMFVFVSSLLFLNVKNKINIFCLMFNSLVIFEYFKKIEDTTYSLMFGLSIYLFLIILYFIFNRNDKNILIISDDNKNLNEKHILLLLSVLIPINLNYFVESILIPYILLILAITILIFSNKYLSKKYYKIIFLSLILFFSTMFSYALGIAIFFIILLITTYNFESLKTSILKNSLEAFRNLVLTFIKHVSCIGKEKYFLISLMVFLLITKILFFGKV